ncbi:MAG TPA: TonB-dependent receptor plug domain-containing protein [Lacunisphaera sp.]
MKSEKDNNFVGKSSLSSTRIAVDLSEIPQSVTVLNNSFVQALGPTMLSDVLNYVGGGQSGQLNWTPGRMNIRGFTGDADYVDGFAPTAATAQDAAIFDRMEIIKGPSAIFMAADGSPGGIQNKITKNPLTDSSTEVTVQVGLFAGNKITLDSTGALTKDKKLSYRVVASESYWNDYYKYTYMHRFVGYGALEYDFSANTKLVIKGELSHVDWPSYNGLPVDPRTGKVLDVSYDSTQDLDSPQNWRTDYVDRVWANFSSRLNDHVAINIKGMRAYDDAKRFESIAPTWSEGTTNGTALINGVSTPVTFLGGKWTSPSVSTSETLAPVNYVLKNGVYYVTDSWGGTSNYTGGAIPRSTINADDAHQLYNDVQADVNFNWSAKYFNELLLVGGEHRDSPGYTLTYKNGVSTSAWFPYAPNTPATVVTNYTAPSAFTNAQSKQDRFYILETLKLFKDSFILNWGVTRARTFASTYNDLTHTWVGVPNGYTLFKNLVQNGITYKVLPNVALFYGSNQNFAANGTGTLNGVPNSVLPAKTGQQHEVGIKSDFLNHRLTANISYFDVHQQNNTAPSFPSDPLNPNVLIPGVISRGFDGDLSFKVSKELYLIASFANYSAKSILGATYDGYQGAIFLQPATGRVALASVPVDNTAEHTYSLFGLYQFNRKLSIGLGGNYLSKRAITDGTNQVFWGYIPSRLLVDANIKYEYNRHISYTLSIANLLDTKYIYSSRSEDVIVMGSPINLRMSASYKF